MTASMPLTEMLNGVDLEVARAFLADAASSSLSAAQAAAMILPRIDGATPLQLLSVAIDLLREEREHHAAVIDGLNDDIAGLEDDVADLEIAALKGAPAS